MLTLKTRTASMALCAGLLASGCQTPQMDPSSEGASLSMLSKNHKDYYSSCRLRGGAVIALPGSQMTVSGNAEVNGDVFLLNGTQLHLSGNARIDGNVMHDPSASLSRSGHASEGGTTSMDLSIERQAITEFAQREALLSPTQTIAALDGSQVLNGNGGLNIVQVQGDIRLAGHSALEIDGSESDTFIINVLGAFSVSGGANITLHGGLRPENVLFNVVGSGSDLSLSGNGEISGMLLAINRGVSVTGNGRLKGALMSGGSITISGNGFALDEASLCLLNGIPGSGNPAPTPTPSSDPTGSPDPCGSPSPGVSPSPSASPAPDASSTPAPSVSPSPSALPTDGTGGGTCVGILCGPVAS
jgi:choice-of-anchor A domain-containing protein